MKEGEKNDTQPDDSCYGSAWDRYVSSWERKVEKTRQQDKAKDVGAEAWLRLADERSQLKYPGDEWGTEESWKRLFQALFAEQGVKQWAHAFEIGAGSGKYTDFVLSENADIKICCLDVSINFLQIVKERFRSKLGTNLALYQIVQSASDFPLEDAFSGLGWPRLDAVYSIDAMVHVDLQYLMSYWISASKILKPGGKLIMTLADCTSAGGFSKLVRDVRSFFKMAGKPSYKFEWLCPEAVRFILTKLGFDIILLESPGRDLWLAAELVETNRELDALYDVPQK